jgi:predicted HD phosphohydrolase
MTESEVVSFTSMADGTAADYALLERLESEYADGLANRVMVALKRLSDSLGGYQIDRLAHSLQSATRARRDGANTEWIIATLVHDIGDELAPYNHGELAASILQPYVSEEVCWVIRHHGIFQSYYYAHHLGGDRNARDAFADNPWSDLCVEFCERWDQNSFDPTYANDDLASFESELREVFGRQAWAEDVIAIGSERLT